MEALLSEETEFKIKATDNASEANILHIKSDGNKIKQDVSKSVDPTISLSTQEEIEIKIWRNKKVILRKPFLYFRITQFLWFGSGKLIAPFFSLILKRRGLAIIEFSSVFSMICVFQLTVAYISGIVTDKIGNAKPVLMFNMLMTMFVIICMLVAPSVNDKNCIPQHRNLSCFDALVNRKELDYCNSTCFYNFTNFFNVNRYNESGNDISLTNFTAEVQNNKSDHEFDIYINETDNPCTKICSCINYSQDGCGYNSLIWYKVLYGIIILCFYSFWSTTYRFLDLTSVSLTEQSDSHYGWERSFAQAGEIFAVVLANFVLNVDKSDPNDFYDNVYWFSVVLILLAAVSIFNIKAVIVPPGKNLIKSSLKLVRNIEAMSFLVVVFIAGNAYTFNQFYHFWFLDTLNAPKEIFGLQIVCRSILGLIMFVSSQWWLKLLEIKKIFILGLFFYTINQVSYSFLLNPWLSLIVECTILFSFYLFWVSVVVHCRNIAPKGLAATVNAVAGTIHFGVGRSTSVSVGGLLIGIYGMRKTYRIFASFCLTTAILYSMFLYVRHLFFSRKFKSQGKQLGKTKNLKKESDQGIELC